MICLQDETGFSLFTSDELSIYCDDTEVLDWLQSKMEAIIQIIQDG